ncbi:hypothetical protein [Chitinophaga sp. YR627]|uniref:hypothetical protein n=1 Tax=Chitinophaga sp. YR627 TaxID=1881041 RepID=UPI003977A3FA
MRKRISIWTRYCLNGGRSAWQISGNCFRCCLSPTPHWVIIRLLSETCGNMGLSMTHFTMNGKAGR